MIVNSIQEDDCCQSPLAAYLLDHPEILEWACPKCGTDWAPICPPVSGALGEYEFRHWVPHVDIEFVL